eukprot:EC716547.1.p1 GENE.EC716547.1~~EC716547.1.p1  ORF type:complete len:188 (+),score=32.76 EC716547.1:56-619(+)
MEDDLLHEVIPLFTRNAPLVEEMLEKFKQKSRETSSVHSAFTDVLVKLTQMKVFLENRQDYLQPFGKAGKPKEDHLEAFQHQLLLILMSTFDTLGAAAWKCMKLLSQNVLRHGTLVGSPVNPSLIRLCYDGFEMFRAVGDDMLEKTRIILRSVASKRVVESIRPRVMVQEQTSVALKREGESCLVGL